MKKMMNFALTAVLTVGLSLSVTSCKDDDKSDNGGGENMEQLESTGGTVSLEDIQLSTLISNFANEQADELLAQSGWQSKTYEATIGTVTDQSRPTVRSIEVGTIEAADERAEAMLRELGINGESPAGFTFTSASVGTVSYQHGGGADANTLAVINLNIKQLPGITQLRMVKMLGDNDETFAYYSLGDIVKKNGRLYICTRPAAKKGDFAYFVSFWTLHRTDNCRWGTYKDVVYLANDEMASETDLTRWLHNFVMSETGYNKVIRSLKDKNVTNPDSIDQLLPPTENIRRELIKRLHYNLATLPVEPLNNPRWIEENKWGDTPKANGRYCAPKSLLLTNKFRYAIDPCRYWVPFVGWATVDEAKDIKAELQNMKTQNAKTNSNHFQFDVSNPLEILDNQTKQDFAATNCQYVVASVYWTHNYYTLDDKINQWAMFDFTKDWNDKQDINDDNVTDISLWLSCNIESSTLKFRDDGGANNTVEPVWVAREDVKEKENDPAVGKIIGKNGKFYETVEDATLIGGGAVAMVVYTGGDNRVENDKDWNGLAMALDAVSEAAWLDNKEKATECPLKGYSVHDEAHFYDFAGIANTETLVAGCNHGHNHAIAKQCVNYNVPVPTDGNFSAWFLPSYGQLRLAHLALGGKYKEEEVFGKGTGKMIFTEASKNIFATAGVNTLWDKYNQDLRWTSTKSTKVGEAVLWCKEYATDNFENSNEVTLTAIAIPFIAFKYGEGGKENIKDEHVAQELPQDPPDDDDDDDNNNLGGDDDGDDD